MNKTICIIGLGYVGLPLALEFAKKYKVIGFDVNKEKINDLNNGVDTTGEVKNKNELLTENLIFTNNPEKIKESDFVIVAVPTPVLKSKIPDLKYVESASKLVGENLKSGSIVVFESTVYPGVTEEICAPIIEKYSGLKCSKDFKIGYSPERINPGDKEHTLTKIVKVVSGMDEESLNEIAEVYGSIIEAGVFKARDIKTAEAAKVIENIQRDLNIALMNELAIIFREIGINTKDVLDAAGTKWNFHKYFPGMVGGHCIPVDPYYLTYKAQMLGYHPDVILAGRRINDYMPKHVAEIIVKGLNKANKVLKGSRILLMGLTFKDNVPDIRNSPVKELIKELKEYEMDIIGFDPFVKENSLFGIKNLKNLDEINKIDCIVIVNAHDNFKKIKQGELKNKMSDNPLIVDVKGMFNRCEVESTGINYYTL